MKSIILLVCLLASQILFAQKIDFGQEYKDDKADEGFDLIGETKSSIYFSKTHYNPLYSIIISSIKLERYDKTTKAKTADKELNIPKIENRDCNYYKILTFDNNLLLLFQVINGNTKKVFAQKINEDLSFSGAPILINEITDMFEQRLGSVAVNATPPFENPFIEKTQNGNSFYCLQVGITEKEGNKKEFVLAVYDTDLKQISKKQNVLPIETKEFEILSNCYNKKGFLFLVTKSISTKRKEKNAYDVIITDGSVTTKIPIAQAPEKNEIESAKSILDNNDNMLVVGLYGEPGVTGILTPGFFFGKFSSDSKESNIKFEGFNKEIEENFYWADLRITNLRRTSNNGLFIVITRGNSGKNSSSNVGFGNIVVHMKSDLTIDWSKNIYYNQWFYAGFDVFCSNDKLGIILNDNLINTTLDDKKPKPYKGKNAATFCVLINEKGEAVKKELINYPNSEDARFTPGMGIGNSPLSKNYLFFITKNSYKFGELSLD